MNRSFSRAIQHVVLVLMVGSLWVMGYVVAPALFSFVEDNSLAGSIAGHMFHLGSWISLVCGLILISSIAFNSTGKWFANKRIYLLALMLAGLSVIEFVLNPMVQNARGTDAFGLLHGASSVLYLLVSCLGLFLVIVWEQE